MDLLPGPDDELAVTHARPILDAHFGVDAWAERLRTGAAVPDPVVADLAAAVRTARSAPQAVVVALELGRMLAPVETLGALVVPEGRVALAVPRRGGGILRFGTDAPDAVLVWRADGVGRAPSEPGEPVDGIDPTTPTRRCRSDDAVPLGPAITRRARAAGAGYLAGLAHGALDLAVGHARTRIQFDRPIGANQAVKHRLADAATRAEAARATALYAATALAEGHADDEFWVAAAARVASDASDANARAAIQVHGGRGYTLDCPAHLFLGRARIVLALLGGVPGIRAGLTEAAPDPSDPDSISARARR